MYYHYGTQVRRKVFISYYHGDQNSVNAFISEFSDIFIPKAIGIRDGDFNVDSNDPQYIMRSIRENILEDSTVTIVLIGDCTHSRRYVDWEIKASLQKGLTLPNGLIGILLNGDSGHLPPRFHENWERGEENCYTRYRSYPSSANELRNWIEDAYSARTSRANLIRNSNEMMKYNQKCEIHKTTHPAG